MKNRKEIYEEKAKSKIYLLNQVEQVLLNPTQRHIYIYSLPGIGKTHTTEGILKKLDINYHKISGDVTPISFATDLAVLNYKKHNDERIFILIDDCESIFNDVNFLNTLKNILEGKKRELQYNKFTSSLLKRMNTLQQQAVEFHQRDERMGFCVPTDKFTFIFLSNIKLPTATDLKKAKVLGKNRELLAHRSAIRSRCKTIDINLTNDSLWGWVSLIVKHHNVFEESNIPEGYNTKESIEQISISD